LVDQIESQAQLVGVLQQVLAEKANDEYQKASAFADKYAGGMLIGDYSKATYTAWYNTLTEGPAYVEWTDDTDSVSKDSSGGWHFGLKKSDHVSASQHEAAHAKWTPFNYTQAVADRMNDNRVSDIANIIEDRRIEFLADVWWQGSHIYDRHRADLIRDLETRRADRLADVITRPINARPGFVWQDHNEGALGPQTKADKAFAKLLKDLIKSHQSSKAMMERWDAEATCSAIMAAVYNLPVFIQDELVTAIMAEFGDKIMAAGMSFDHYAAVRVAVEIACFMDWWPTRPRGRTAGDGSEQKSNEPPEPGEGEGTSPTPDDAGDDSEQQGEGQGQPKNEDTDDTKDTSPGQGTPSNGTGKPWEEQQAHGIGDDLITKLDKLALMEDLAEAVIEEQIKSESVGVAKHIEREARLLSLSDGHNASILNIETQPIPRDARVRAMLDSISDISRSSLLRNAGVVTPKVWQIRQGNLKVFKQPPKKRGQTLILVDCSSSMHCPCIDCNEEADKGRYNAGYKAWQTAGAIAKATGNADVYGFAGNGFIAKMPPGHQPACKSRSRGKTRVSELDGATPICFALLYAEQLIQGGEANSTLVLITDGAPSTFRECRNIHGVLPGETGPEKAGLLCTRKVADRLRSAGADFVAVTINYTTKEGDMTPFPASITTNLSTHSRNMEDMAGLADAIRHIRGR